MKLLLSLIVCLSIFANAQNIRPVTELPDISVVGKFLTTVQDSQTSVFDVDEVEFFFQHYLAPGTKATVVAAISQDDSTSEYAIELEEAYVTFSDLFDTLMPNYSLVDGVGFTVGKKLLPIGRINALHSEQWTFVDTPLVNQQFFGTEHNLSGQGGLVTYLLPLPFFSQLEAGYWSTTEEDESTTHEEIEYSTALTNVRLWNNFVLSNSQDLDLGVSYVLGNADASSTDDQQTVMGLDAMFNQKLSKTDTLSLHGEYYSAQYAEDGESRETQTGGFISAYYDANLFLDAGVRYGILSQHGDEGDEKKQWSFILSRQLTEASKLRLQYSTGENIDNTIYVQYVFGMGPHSHVLQ